MDETLPLHPMPAGPGNPADPGKPRAEGGPSPGPGHELESRRDALRARMGAGRYRRALDDLVVDAACNTLRLTGGRASDAEVAAARRGEPTGSGAFDGVLAAHRRTDAAAASDAAWPTPDAMREVHALATGAAPAPTPFRIIQIEPQFPGASLSPPQTIGFRVADLLTWIDGRSGRDLATAARAALFFGRILEISPFERGNFRMAHVMLSGFARASGYPPIWLDVDEAAGIRQDVSRAFRFETEPLVARMERALFRSLEGAGRGTAPVPAEGDGSG